MPPRSVQFRARPRPVAALVVLSLAGLGLTACGPDTPTPDATVAALADGMAGGDLASVPFDGATVTEATTHRDEVVAPLGEATHAVTPGDVVVAEDGKSATAELEHAWEIGGTPWTYTTTADLTLVEEEWRVTWEPDILVPDLALGERLQTSRTAAPRGDVLGAGDQPIVTGRPVRRVGIDKTLTDAASWDTSARELAGLLELDAEAYAAKVAAAGEKAFVEAIVLRLESDTEWGALTNPPGAVFVDDVIPLAPSREFAAPILGRAGDATAEIVEASGGAVEAGDLVGLSGLQRQYDEQLRGTPGRVVEIVAADGTVRDALRQEPVPGEPLRTTLDPAVQLTAEGVLAATDVPSALVAIRPSTGEVLAAASGTAGGGLSTATTGMYPPGSTFKVVTALALMRTGVTPESPLSCTPEAVVDGRAFRNFPDYPSSALGDIPLRSVIANSCNTALINASGQVTQEALADAAAALGLGLAQQPGPDVFTGNVPLDSAGTDHAASMIGQGRVQASPLAMATVAASVAAGTTVRPTFLAQETTAAGEPSELPTAPASPLTAEEAAQLQGLMRAVVTEGGAQFLADLPGEVAAKTGTAQYGDGSTNHVWMIATRGDLAVAVFVETGEYGSTTAGPLLESFLTSVE